MALITISGYPCSGKTKRAEQIKSDLEKRLEDPATSGPKLKVVIISDDILNTSRDSYNDARSEKLARGTLFAAMQRQSGQDTILIVDGMNYIKGFRYQMYCAARELKLRVCTVYVMSTPELCRAWNQERQDGKRYAAETLDDLVSRFEEPSSMVRWDSPLFSVPWTDEDVPGDEIWQAVTGGTVKPPNAGTQSVPKAPSDALYTLEQTTASTVSAFMRAQELTQGCGGPTLLTLSATLERRTVLPTRNVTLSELQRLKRQFVTVYKKAITLGTTEKGAIDWSEENIAEKFVAYLTENLNN